ncbi:MAG: hypothetical protein WA896_01625 [Spirulinaceae cyanobacterium]
MVLVMGNHRTYLQKKSFSKSSTQPPQNKPQLNSTLRQPVPTRQSLSLEEMEISRKNAERLGDHIVDFSQSAPTPAMQTKLAIEQAGDKQQIQRFIDLGAVWDKVTDVAEDVWDALTDTETKKENSNAATTTEEVDKKKEKKSTPLPPQDVVVPKPSHKKNPGLPDKPELEHPEFSALVEEMAQMEQNPLVVEKKHKEEIGEARTERVEKIAELRGRIATLGTAIPDVDATQIENAQAYLYRRLAPLVPYFGQMANTNMLTKTNKKGGKGWDRTCNVTVPAMVLQGIGKTKDDYVGSKQLLENIFAALEGKYKERKLYDPAADFDSLRLPDFMALVAIAKHISGGGEANDETFVAAVSEARKKAANKTTHHATMMYLIEQFGGQHQKYSVYAKELDQIGGAQKAYTKAQLRGENPEKGRKKYNEINEELQQYSEGEERDKAFKKLKKSDQKIYQTLWKYDQLNQEKAEELLPANTYRDAVLKKINPLLDGGAQILVGMEGHFLRLDGLDENTVQVDDPGEKGFKDLQVTWEQARGFGYFKGFWAIT